MNTRSHLSRGAGLLAASIGVFIVAPAGAQEATLFPGDSGYRGSGVGLRATSDTLDRVLVIGQRTRQSVSAELERARAEGTFDRGGEATFVTATPWASTLTRAQVLATVMRAKADGTFDTSGEHWIGQDNGGRDPRFFAGGDAVPVLASAR